MRVKFSPLFHEDGTPSYFRVSCLALFAMSLVLHVVLKGENSDSNSLTIAEANPSLVPDNNSSQAVQGNIVAVAPMPSTNNQQVAINSVQNTATQKGSSSFVNYGQAHGQSSGSMTSNMSANVSASTVEVKSSTWSFFDSEGKEAQIKQLIANRKKALAEFTDGVGLLSSCGVIKGSFASCSFNFSKSVKEHYDTVVRTNEESFVIGLQAKGQQAQDVCSKFVVHSNGNIMTIDRQGVHNQRCLLDAINNDQIIALQRSIYSLQSFKENQNNNSPAVLAESASIPLK